MIAVRPGAAATCARPGCDRPLVRKPRGRPPLYCSAACRHLVARKGPLPRLTVEVDHERDDETGRPTGHVWLVRLRRGDLVVEVATGLGRPSADYLARQLREVIEPQRRAEGGAMG
jgi:hypothetical protein